MATLNTIDLPLQLPTPPLDPAHQAAKAARTGLFGVLSFAHNQDVAGPLGCRKERRSGLLGSRVGGTDLKLVVAIPFVDTHYHFAFGFGRVDVDNPRLPDRVDADPPLLDRFAGPLHGEFIIFEDDLNVFI